MASKHVSDGKVPWQTWEPVWKFLGTNVTFPTLFSQVPSTSSQVHPIQQMLPGTWDLSLDSIFHTYYLIKNCFPKRRLSWISQLLGEAAKIHFSPSCQIPVFVDAESYVGYNTTCAERRREGRMHVYLHVCTEGWTRNLQPQLTQGMGSGRLGTGLRWRLHCTFFLLYELWTMWRYWQFKN